MKKIDKVLEMLKRAYIRNWIWK